MRIVDKNIKINNNKLLKLLGDYFVSEDKNDYLLQRLFVSIVDSSFLLPVEKINKIDNKMKISIKLLKNGDNMPEVMPIFTSIKEIEKVYSYEGITIIEVKYQDVLKLLVENENVEGIIINPRNEENCMSLNRDNIQIINDEIARLKQSLKVDNENIIPIIKEFISGGSNTDEYVNHLIRTKFLSPIKVKKHTVFAFIEDTIGFGTINCEKSEYYFPVFTSYDLYRNHYGYNGEHSPIIMTTQELSELVLGVNDKCRGIVINPHKDNIVFPKEYLIRIGM